MSEAAPARTLATVIEFLARERATATVGPGDRRVETELSSWTVAVWRSVLLDLPLDAHGFLGRFERSWDEVIHDIDEWCARARSLSGGTPEGRSEIYGQLGL